MKSRSVKPGTKNPEHGTLPLSVGQRVYLSVAGYAVGSKVFLPKGARGVVTQADPTGDMLTIQFDLAAGPVAGLRLPVSHVEKIAHDPQPPKHD